MKPSITSLHILSSQPALKIQQTQLYDQLTKLQQTIHSKLASIKKLRNINYLCEHTNTISKTHTKQNFSSYNKTEQNHIYSNQQKTINDKSQNNSNVLEINNKEYNKTTLQTNNNTINQSSQYLILQKPHDIIKYNQKTNYYDKFWKLFLMNQNTAWKLNQLYDNLQEINKTIIEIQKMFLQRQKLLKLAQTLTNEKNIMKKRKSRSSLSGQSQPQDKVLCPYPECYKLYGSEISLNLHIKLKHNGGNKSQRQYYAEQLWLNVQNREKEPQNRIMLAPGYFEEYGMVTGRISKQEYEGLRKVNSWVEGQVDRKLLKKLTTAESQKQMRKNSLSQLISINRESR